MECKEEGSVKNNVNTSDIIQKIVTYLILPAVMAIISYYFSMQIENAKQEFKQVELDVKRIEASHKFISEIFSGNLQRALLSEKLLIKILDDEVLSTEISETVHNFYLAELTTKLNNNGTKDYAKILNDMKKIESPSAKKILENTYFIIINTTEDITEAKDTAIDLRQSGIKAEVLTNNDGLFFVSYDRGRLDDVVGKIEAAQKIFSEDKPFLMTWNEVKKYVYPEDPPEKDRDEKIRKFKIEKLILEPNKYIFYYDIENNLSMDLNGRSATTETMKKAKEILEYAKDNEKEVTIYYKDKTSSNGKEYELLTKIFIKDFCLLPIERKYTIN